MKTCAAARNLEAMYAAVGLKCEIDPGTVGLCVYAATKATVTAVADALAGCVRAAGLPVEIIDYIENDPDFPPESACGITVHFDWDAFPSSVKACEAILAPKGRKS